MSLNLKVPDRILDLPGIAFVSFILFWLWVLVVDPVPERDSYAGFYYPFLNYLKASLEFPNDFWFLTDQVVLNDYPRGGFGLAWLISALGLQPLFLKEPYLVAVFLILPLSLVPLFFHLSRRERWALGLLILFFPPTQVLLKSFSLHGFNVVYALVGILCFRSYLARGKSVHLLGFALAFWFAMITKHLGLLLFFNFILAYLIYCLFNRKFDPAAIITIILVSVVTLPFYYLESFMQYVEGVLGHNPSLSVAQFTLFFCFLVFFCIVLAFVLARWSRNKFPLKFFSSPIILVLASCLPLVLVSLETESDHANLHTLVAFILGYGGIFWALFNYRLSSIRSFLYLFAGLTYVNGLLLYLSLVGKTSYVFFLPLLLILILTFQESKSSYTRAAILVMCLLISNFGPSSREFQTWTGGYGLNFCLNGLNGIHINPLGWQVSEIPKIQEEMIEVLQKWQYPNKNSLALFDHLHFYSRLLLSFPPNFLLEFPSFQRLDDLPPHQMEEIFTQYARMGAGLFDSWNSDGKFPFLVMGLRPWDLNLGAPQSLQEKMRSSSPDGEFGQSLSRAFFDYLETSGKLKELYEDFLIPKGNPRIKLYVRKDLPPAFGEPFRLNASLSEVSWHLPVDFRQESKPPWFEKIQVETQQRILNREASHIQQAAQDLLNKADYLKGYELLRKAHSLTPNNAAIKHDLQKVEQSIPPSLWIFLKQKGLAPLD